MKPSHKLLITCCVLPVAAHAAPITWGSIQSITGPSNISSTGVTSLAGANFGLTSGTTLTINNGDVDIDFESLNSGQSAALDNGITVAASSDWINFGFNSGNSTQGGNFGAILDRNLGLEPPESPATATITLAGLSSGTQYQIQVFIDSTGNNGQVVSGSATMNSLPGQYVVGTFTADAPTQELSVTATSGGFGVINALTIGTVGGGPDITPPAWTATWPQAEQLSPTSITVRAQTNETGTAYYVVLSDGATAPSAAQVKAGTDSSNTPATASGNLTLTANTEASGPVSSLTANTSYDVYFIAEDSASNLQATPVLVDVALVTPAVVTWGGWTDVTDESAILTPGGYTYGGVNFNGSNTTINSLAFTGIVPNGSGVTNGITVSTTGFAFQSTGSGNSNVVSAAGSPQTWATVLDRVIGDNNNSASIDLTGLTPGDDYTVQFFSSTPDGGINQTTKIASGGVESPAFGAHGGGQTKSITASFTATGTSQSFAITGVEPTFGALVVGAESSNTFASWIGGYSGLNGLTGFDDDADFDGLDNGLENFLGTAPNAGNAGLTAGALSGNVFSFAHPQNATPASDVSGPVYTWSTDLVSWNASGASSGGITVALAPATNTPSAGTTTVSATVTGPMPAKLFVRLSVSQN